MSWRWDCCPDPRRLSRTYRISTRRRRESCFGRSAPAGRRNERPRWRSRRSPVASEFASSSDTSRKCWDSGGSCGAVLRRATMNGSLCARHTTCSSYGGMELTRSIKCQVHFVWRRKEKKQCYLLRDAPFGKNLRAVLHRRKSKAVLKTTSFRWIPSRRSMVRQQIPKKPNAFCM